MGKVIGQSREIEKCALVCRYYAENAATLLADEDVKTEATKLYYLSTHWSNFSGNAMELSILSSYSLCYSIINGRKHRSFETHQMFKDVLLQSRMLLLRQDFQRYL
jgi:hypothetical protein